MSIKFVLWLLVFPFYFNVVLLGEGTSYGSSYSLPVNPAFKYSEKDADCLAWNFILLGTLNHLVKQTNIHYMKIKRQEDPDFNDYAKPLPETHVDEIIPARKMRKIISTIIDREGGVCSRELLYERSCVLNSRRGPAYALSFYSDIKVSYFSQVMGIPMDQEGVSEFDAFLHNHMSEYSETKTSLYGLYCSSESLPCLGGIFRHGYFSYHFHNNFGFCMLAKHQDFLKINNIFDFKFYNDVENFHGYKMDKDSLKEFIKRSNRMAEEAVDSQ